MAPTIEDWRVELIQAHPTLFRPPVGAPEATQGYPMCSDGWRDLLERLFTRIKAAIAEGSGSLRAVEIKETYGTVLRHPPPRSRSTHHDQIGFAATFQN